MRAAAVVLQVRELEMQAVLAALQQELEARSVAEWRAAFVADNVGYMQSGMQFHPMAAARYSASPGQWVQPPWTASTAAGPGSQQQAQLSAGAGDASQDVAVRQTAVGEGNGMRTEQSGTPRKTDPEAPGPDGCSSDLGSKRVAGASAEDSSGIVRGHEVTPLRRETLGQRTKLQGLQQRRREAPAQRRVRNYYLKDDPGRV